MLMLREDQTPWREPHWVPWLIHRRFISHLLKIVLQVDAGLQVVPVRGNRGLGEEVEWM